MSVEKGRLDAYLNTITRLEPDITPIDAGGAYASIAISLKRIADLMQLRAELDGTIKSGELLRAELDEAKAKDETK